MLRRFLILALFVAHSGHAYAAPEDYRLRKQDSTVGFTWFLGQEAITGSMPVARADITLDFDRPSNSRVTVAVDAANARAGALFASEAMKGPGILWTAQHPEITFTSRTVRRDGAGGAVVTGDLTVRGVTQPQVFTARFFRPAGTVAGDRSRLTIRLDGELSRSAFGAGAFANFVGDTVALDIRAMVERSE